MIRFRAAGRQRPDFTDKVVLITGASTGIGRATAIAFREAGARVALAARSTEALETLARRLGGPKAASPLTVDVSDPQQCQRMVEQTIAEFGSLDVLINNAGMLVSGKFEHLQPGDMERQFAVNYFGVVYCTRAALPHLKQSRGAIVNIASVAGFFGLPTSGAYSASKAALISLGQTLYVELKPYGIGVVTVCPYFTSGAKLAEKGILREGGLHRSRRRQRAPGTQTTEQVAEAILRAAYERPRLVVLSPFGRLAWRLNRFAPWLTDALLTKIKN
ncbi:MAG: SDR family oxidoreductase [Chloroflexi bacterium]|nr:SDR family oxidoreductase [Chloroflexota bacterium]